MKLIHSSSLSKYNFLCHFTTTTEGGVSEGNYATLNLGMYSGDSLENVMENRLRLSSVIGLPLENLFFPHQTHQDKIYVIDEEFLHFPKNRQDELLDGVDALITNVKSVCIGVTTADCVPILLFDPVRRVFAAIHAGWRGTVANIAGKTVDKMVAYFNTDVKDIVAYIGPAISQDIFEVGDEVVLAFENSGFDLKEISSINADTGKRHINLSHSNRILLLQSGLSIENVEISGICTYKNSLLMFSARKQTVNSGRIYTGGYII